MPVTASHALPRVAAKFPYLVEALKERIDSGRLKAGDRLPTFAELRAEFGVTPGTVSRALLSLEQAGLVVREQGRGVFVAHRQLERRQLIGLADMQVTTSCSPYYALLQRGVADAVHREQYELTLLNTQSLRGLEKVDGVIAHGESGLAYLRSLPPGMPGVLVMMQGEHTPSVMADDHQGAFKATEHLLTLGHRRIGFLGFMESLSTQRRLAGYFAAMHCAGLDSAKWVRPLRNLPLTAVPVEQKRDRTREFGRISALHWLRDDWKRMNLSAVIAQNDEIAIGLIQALHEIGLRVPDDVSVVGFDSTDLCEFSTPSLTSVRLPLAKVGEAAGELLLRQVREEKTEAVTVVLPVELDVRASTAAPSKKRNS